MSRKACRGTRAWWVAALLLGACSSVADQPARLTQPVAGPLAHADLRWLNVERRTLNQDRDWPVLTENRAMLGGLFKRLYGLDDARVDRVFPRTRALDIGLI